MYDGSKWSEAYQMENSLHTYHLCNWSENIIADDRKKNGLWDHSMGNNKPEWVTFPLKVMI